MGVIGSGRRRCSGCGPPVTMTREDLVAEVKHGSGIGFAETLVDCVVVDSSGMVARTLCCIDVFVISAADMARRFGAAARGGTQESIGGQERVSEAGRKWGEGVAWCCELTVPLASRLKVSTTAWTVAMLGRGQEQRNGVQADSCYL
jgi:hypothetical protein